jgi:hypothetical protein
MTIRRYILMNVGIAALSGIFIGPFLYVKDKIKSLKKRVKAKPEANR